MKVTDEWIENELKMCAMAGTNAQPWIDAIQELKEFRAAPALTLSQPTRDEEIESLALRMYVKWKTPADSLQLIDGCFKAATHFIDYRDKRRASK